jgi:hypothetical protein
MKRLGLVGAVSALSLALLVPASVSAHTPPAPPFGARVTKAACTKQGGWYGFGKIVLRMDAWARNDLPGSPTPNYIYIFTWLQEKVDGVWVNVGLGQTTPVIYPDGHPGIFEDALHVNWHFTAPQPERTRALMRVEFFDDLPTGDVRLGKKWARTAAC